MNEGPNVGSGAELCFNCSGYRGVAFFGIGVCEVFEGADVFWESLDKREGEECDVWRGDDLHQYELVNGILGYSRH